MASRKAHEVDAWLEKPDRDTNIVLLYGPDRGLVAERARHYASNSGFAVDDPFSVIRIDAGGDDPAGLLRQEAGTVPMFGGRRLLWIRGFAAQAALTEAVGELCRGSLHDIVVLIEGGDLKKTSAVRAAVEFSRTGMALPCYQDEGPAVDRLIAEMFPGKQIDDQARQLLKRSLGADRLVSRSELEKLALYGGDRPTIGIAEVRAVVADASGSDVEDLTDAVLSGDRKAIDEMIRKVGSTPSQAQQALIACLRQFQGLQAMRAAMSSNRQSAEAAVAAARPPIFFARRPLVLKALSQLETTALAYIVRRIQNAVYLSRRHGELSVQILWQTALLAGVEVGRSAQSRTGHTRI